jgi:AraC-like DNA-binding protein/mannose-6-phosphate isomerase-like protein (cupin superfamily)
MSGRTDVLSARPGGRYGSFGKAVPVELLTSPRSDDLGVLLERINVRSAVFCVSDLGAPWGLRVDGSATAKFHLVLDGRATLTLDEPGVRQAELSAGELVLLPHGSAHLIQDHRDSPARPLGDILAELPAGAAERLAYGGDGPRTWLLCGGFALAPGLPENLLSLLPVMLVLDTTSTGINRWLEPAFGLLRDEIARDAPGASAVVAKLADVFLTEIVRRYLSGLDLLTVTVPPAASGDPCVGAALLLLRSQPGSPWTVSDLARKVDMSRTAFAARFRELVGEPPMSYLARVRLGHAAGYLSATDKTVRQIAHMVGYENESSLSKAFRRAFGRAPGEYRRQQAAAHGVRATPAGR